MSTLLKRQQIVKNLSYCKFKRNQSTHVSRSDKRRVVVTGVGVLSSVGCDVASAWNSILNGVSGVSALTATAFEKLPCKVAAQIPKDQFDLEKHFNKSELKTMAPATALALVATGQALDMAQWHPTDESELEGTGVAVGMGMVDLNDVCETYNALQKGYNRVSPYFVPRILPNMAAGQISIKYGFRGPNHSVSTACATGAHSIGDAFRFIQHGDSDVMVCGGAEACISPLAIAGFCRLRALSTKYNDCPEKASRPFDTGRDGFVMGEGAAIFVLEELNHAQARGADIIAEVLGYGLSGDASHLTSPREDGTGALLAMRRAIRDAGITQDEIGYVNAHATSTPVGDVIEARAIKTLFNEHAKNLSVSSTKGAHGHLLGAAGNLESLFTVLACRDGKIPPTINLQEVSNDMDLNFVPNKFQEWDKKFKRRIALKNAFGFGGTNACICFANYVS